jgi:hypothetical protein
MEKLKTKKGNLNFASIAMFSLTLVLVISGLGYTVGYANQNYGTVFNTNISGVDIMSENYTSLDYFVNATQIANVTYNTSTPSTSTMASSQGFITDGISGTWAIMRDLISLAPFGEFRSLLMTAIILIGGIILAILLAQFFFNRNLTS